jgi:hypothetical protein
MPAPSPARTGFTGEIAGTAADAGPAMALAKDAAIVNSEVIDQR